MTQEDKDLVLKDLCARQFYKTKVLSPWKKDGPCELSAIDLTSDRQVRVFEDWYKIEEVKPYLRPMSSMTEGEEKELSMIVNGYGTVITNYNRKEFFLWLYSGDKDLPFPILTTFLNWLNEHHFDYNYLIDMGLALEAPEDMYKTE